MMIFLAFLVFAIGVIVFAFVAFVEMTDGHVPPRFWRFVWLPGWIAAGIFLFMMFGVQPASAQGVACFERDALLTGMQNKYKEVPVGGGLLSGGAAMVILSAPDGKSFSIIAILASGQACLIATGEGLEISQPKNSAEREG